MVCPELQHVICPVWWAPRRWPMTWNGNLVDLELSDLSSLVENFDICAELI